MIPSTMLGKKSMIFFFFNSWNDTFTLTQQLLQGISSSFPVLDSNVLEYKIITEETTTLI